MGVYVCSSAWACLNMDTLPPETAEMVKRIVPTNRAAVASFKKFFFIMFGFNIKQKAKYRIYFSTDPLKMISVGDGFELVEISAEDWKGPSLEESYFNVTTVESPGGMATVK